MNIQSFCQFISPAPNAPLLNQKEITRKIDEWLQSQTFPPLFLTIENRLKLREHFSRICVKAKQIDGAVNYVAGRVIFPKPEPSLEKTSQILQKSNATLQDYKYLHGAVEALTSIYSSFLKKRNLTGYIKLCNELWVDNYFIPKGTPLGSPTFIRISESTTSMLKPQGFIIMFNLMRLLRANSKSDDIDLAERVAVPDEVIQALMRHKKEGDDPVFNKLLDSFLKLHEIGEYLIILEKASLDFLNEPDQNIQHHEVFKALGPDPEKLLIHNLKNQGKNTQSLDTLSALAKEKRGVLLEVYGQMTRKMEVIKENSPFKNSPKFDELYHKPTKNLEEFTQLIDALIDYKIKKVALERIERIQKEVDEMSVQSVNTQPLGELSLIAEFKTKPPNPVPVVEIAPLMKLNRVQRWFDPAQDPFLIDKKYMELSRKIGVNKQNEIRFIHNFAMIIDEIALEYGKTTSRINKNGVEERMISMVIQADTRFSAHPLMYTLTMTFNLNGELYHRTLTQKSQGKVIDEMISSGQYEIEFPALSTMKKQIKLPQVLLNKVADDRSYIKKIDGSIITVADPKWPLDDGSPTLLHLIAI